MGNLLADAWRAIGVDRSPLLADMGPEDRSWWRFILGILCAVVVGLVFSILIAVLAVVVGVAMGAASGADPAQFEDWIQRFANGEIEPTWSLSLWTFVGLGLVNAVMMGLGVWIASALNRKPLKLSFTTAPKWRWRQLFGGLVIYGVAAGAIVLFDVFVGGQKAGLPMINLSPSIGHMVVYAVLMIIAAIIAAGAEELVFRGWLLRHSANLVRDTGVFLLLNGLIFSAIHLHFDPNAFLFRTLLGIGLCWMALRYGGIEFATGAHAANNILILLFIEPLTLRPPPSEPFNPAAGLEMLMVLALMIGTTELSLRWAPIRRLIGGPSDPPRAART